MKALILSNQQIRTDADGRYCLNDLHRSSGGLAKHRPGYWLELEQTKALAAEIEKAGNPAISTKQKVGTFVARELVYAYAMWISAAFHLQVIRSFDAAASGHQSPDYAAALRDPATLRTLLLEQTEGLLRLEREVEELKPRAEAFARLTTKGKSLSMTAAAKALGIPPKSFMDRLAGLAWTYRSGGIGSWQAHQRRIESGYLEHRMVEIDRYGVIELKAQVLVTPKGMARLAELIEKEDAARKAA